MKRLENKLALVTGSSRGVGRFIAQGLASEGARVIVHGRAPENCAETVALVRDQGAEAFVVSGELSSEDSVKKIIDEVNGVHGGVDILYNNAALMNAYQNIWEHTWADWEPMMRVNVYALFQLCQAFAPGMRDRGYGRIINLTSGVGDDPPLTPYATSKSSVDRITRCFAAELRDTGVLVNVLDPGWLKTDMGGPNAPGEVETVLPGALIPALLPNDGPSGARFQAQTHTSLDKLP